MDPPPPHYGSSYGGMPPYGASSGASAGGLMNAGGRGVDDGSMAGSASTTSTEQHQQQIGLGSMDNPQDDHLARDPDYQRLLASLFSPDDDDAWLFEDDGEAFDPTYNPDEESEESDDDAEELQVSELELKTLLDESERPPAAVHPDDASSVLPSSVAPQASVPSAAFVEPPLLLKGPPILPRTFDPSAMVTQTPNLADMIQHPLRDSQRAQLARQLTQHYQLLMQAAALLAFQAQKEQDAESPMWILHRHCYTNVQFMIRQLKASRDAAWKQLRFEPGPKGTGIYAPPPPIAASSSGPGPAPGSAAQASSGAPSSSSSAAALRPVLKKTRAVETRRWTRHDFIRLEGHSCSLFDLPGHAAGEEIIRSIDRVLMGVEELVDGDESLEPWMEGMLADLGKAGMKPFPERNICRLRRKPALPLYPDHEEGRQAAAQAKPLPIPLFTPSEQRLFVMGQRKCGERNWLMISADFLPPRSIQALELFHMCQTDPRAPSNPVKEALTQAMLQKIAVLPFTPQEDVNIVNRAKRCGNDWVRLSKESFPHRSPAELQHRFDILQRQQPSGQQQHQLPTSKKAKAASSVQGGQAKKRSTPPASHGTGQAAGAKKKGKSKASGQRKLSPVASDAMEEFEDIGISMGGFSDWSPGLNSRSRFSSEPPLTAPVQRDGPWRRRVTMEGGRGDGQHVIGQAAGGLGPDDDSEFEKESIASSDDEGSQVGGRGEGTAGASAMGGMLQAGAADDDDEFEKEEIPSDDDDDDDYEHESIASSDSETDR